MRRELWTHWSWLLYLHSAYPMPFDDTIGLSVICVCVWKETSVWCWIHFWIIVVLVDVWASSCHPLIEVTCQYYAILPNVTFMADINNSTRGHPRQVLNADILFCMKFLHIFTNDYAFLFSEFSCWQYVEQLCFSENCVGQLPLLVLTIVWNSTCFMQLNWSIRRTLTSLIFVCLFI